jgi:sirohydrochlorin ferrochelatase
LRQIPQGNVFEVQSSSAFPASPILIPDGIMIGTATLEANDLSLSEQIEAFAEAAFPQGIHQIVIVPLFLLAGIHVKEDLPQEIADARVKLPPRMRLICTPYLGSQGRFKHYVTQRLANTEAERCILLAHGSRRAAGNRTIRQLGTVLNADVAFWSVSPDLETQVYDMMQRGYQRIAIAPYFLFPGGITDAITRQTEELAERFPKLSLRLLSPVGASADLSEVVAELALSVPHGLPQSNWSHSRHPIAENGITA